MLPYLTLLTINEQEPLWEYYNENNTNKEIEIGIDLQPNTTYYVFVGIIDSIGVYVDAMQELTTSIFWVS